MALGHGSTSKKHRKSRREGTPAEDAPKPIKSLMQALWRRHSSSASNANNTIEKESTSPRNRTLSPNQSQSPLSRKVTSPPLTSLEQAQRIARGQIDEIGASERPEDSEEGEEEEEEEEEVYDVAYQAPVYTTQTPLPGIPENGEGEASVISSSQMERLKASVVRRANARSDRSEFKSAPPAVYWPDDGTPTQLAKPQKPQKQQSQPDDFPMDRLPRIAPLSRPTSTVIFAGTRSPVSMSSCASPTRTLSPTPYPHGPLPRGAPTLIDRRGTKMSKSFNLGTHHSGPMWQAIPPKSPTGEIEVVDTTVYSNIKIPLLR